MEIDAPETGPVVVDPKNRGAARRTYGVIPDRIPSGFRRNYPGVDNPLGTLEFGVGR
jgi:hypothetical protein